MGMFSVFSRWCKQDDGSLQRQLLDEQNQAAYYKQRYYAEMCKRKAERKKERALVSCCDYVLSKWCKYDMVDIDFAMDCLDGLLKSEYLATIRKDYSEYNQDVFVYEQTHGIITHESGETND